jgi:hypothetical protein
MDSSRIKHTIPHLLRVLGNRFTELKIIVDLKPTEGRIRDLHGPRGSFDELHQTLGILKVLDNRIDWVHLPNPKDVPELFDEWFATNRRVVRCQAGTPIFAFVYGIHSAKNDIVLHLDCDILLKDAGWFDAMIELLSLKRYSIVEPARFGDPRIAPQVISTRAFAVNRAYLKETILPIRPCQLTGLRRWHRIITGRSIWLALEQTFEVRKQQKLLSHLILPASLGWSLHIPKIDHVKLDGFEKVVRAVESGDIPESQFSAGWDFHPASWKLS